MKSQFSKHPIIFSFLIVLYLVAMWLSYNLFGALGLSYVVLVPIPIVVLSVLTQNKKAQVSHTQAQKTSQLPTIWATPIPYLSIVLVASLLIFTVSKFV